MFWKRGKAKEDELQLPGPTNIPEIAARHMIAEEKKDPDWVWKLKGVVRPAGKMKAFYCRVFDAAQAAQAGVKVKDWSSLDEHAELILWEGYFDKGTNEGRREKFAKPFSSSD